MKKLIAEQNLKHERTSQGFLLILGIIVALILVIQVVIANRLVEQSSRLKALDGNIADVEVANQKLSEEIRIGGSLEAITTRAIQLGFQPSARYAYLQPNAPVAFERSLGSALQ